MNSRIVRPPLVMAAINPTLLVRQGDIEVWSADVKAVRHGCSLDVFEGVLFREENRGSVGRVVQIVGIDHEDGVDPQTPEGLVDKQKAFIDFVRRETALDKAALGPASKAFPDSEFSAECEASMAYLALRGLELPFVVGFRNHKGEFEVCAIEPGEKNLADRAYVTPYEELGGPDVSTDGSVATPRIPRHLH